MEGGDKRNFGALNGHCLEGGRGRPTSQHATHQNEQASAEEKLKAEIENLRVEVRILNIFHYLLHKNLPPTEEEIKSQEGWKKMEEERKITRTTGNGGSTNGEHSKRNGEASMKMFEEEKRKLEEEKRNIEMSRRLLEEHKLLEEAKSLLAEQKRLVQERSELEKEKRKVPTKKTEVDDDKNTGDKNTGDKNAGDKNTGDKNTGDKNTGTSDARPGENQKLDTLLKLVEAIGLLLIERENKIKSLEEKLTEFSENEDLLPAEKVEEKEELIKTLEKERKRLQELEDKLKDVKTQLKEAVKL